MGRSATERRVPSPLSSRSKRGVVLGALVGALVGAVVGWLLSTRMDGLPLDNLGGVLAVVGWIVGGVVGAELFEAGSEDLSLLYSVETLSFSLVIVVSEWFLLTVLLEDGLPMSELAIAAAGLGTLLIFLSCDDPVRNGYNLLIVFGILGLFTLAFVPMVAGAGGNGGTTPTPTATQTPTPEPPPATPPANETAYDPDWTFSIVFDDNTTYEYYAERWTLQWVGNVATYETRQAAYDERSTLESAVVSRLTIEHRPNGSWEIVGDFGEHRAVASRWVFRPQRVSTTPTRSGWVGDDLTIYDQRDVATVEIDQRLRTHQLQSIAESGIQPTQTRETEREGTGTTETETPRETTTQVSIPWWLFLIYAGLFVFGGLLRGWEAR